MLSAQQNDLVLQALENILESPGFAKASQLRNFLDYVVHKTLAGRAHELKGYTIGVEALGRREDFDPQTDTTVRVMAGRLRRALNEYNSELGKNQPAHISIPKGSYVPVFRFSDEPPAHHEAGEQTTNNATVEDTRVPPVAAASSIERSTLRTYLPIIALLLGAAVAIGYWAGYFESREQKSGRETMALEEPQLPSIGITLRATDEPTPAWFSLEEATAGTASAFSRFKEFRIYEVDNAMQPIGADNSPADYHFSAHISRAGTSDNLTATVTLTNQSDGAILWSDNVLLDERNEVTGIDVRSVAGKIIAPLLSPYGVIYGNIASRKNVPAHMRCMSLVYSYFLDEDANKYAKARDCAETVARSGMASSSMHAVLSLLYINAYNRQIPDIGDDPLAMADKAASNAIELDPQNARAHQAVFAVHRARGHRQKALESASRAIALNPFDSSIVGNLAVYLVVIGKLEDAGPLLTRAFELNTARPVWLELFAYLHAELSGRFEEADQIAEGLSPPASPMAALAVVLSALRNGDTQTTEIALNVLQRMEPDFLADPATALLRRGFDASIAERIAARLVTIESNNTLRFASQIPSGPKIAILPVQELSDDAELNQFSRGFAIQLGHDLAKFKDLYLISTNSSLSTDKQSLREITPGLDYIVQASSKRQDAGIRLDMQLLQAGDERVLWSQTYDRKLTAGNLHQVQSEISADIAAQLGTSYGLIQQLETKRVKLNSKLLLSDYACTLRFYSYAADKSPAAHLLQRECLLKVTEKVPQYARAWSMLSWVYGDEIRYNYNLSSVQKAKDNALRAALQAVHLDSTDFFTHQYLAVAYALRDQHDLARRSIERALRLNPNDSDLLARAGWQRIYDGDWETGLLLANKAMQLNPAHPRWYRVMPFINHYRKGEYEEALAQIEAHADDKTSTELIGRMVVLQKLGRHEEAIQLKQILQRDFSAFAAEPAKHIARMQLPADVADDIFETLMSIATNKTTAGD